MDCKFQELAELLVELLVAILLLDNVSKTPKHFFTMIFVFSHEVSLFCRASCEMPKGGPSESMTHSRSFSKICFLLQCVLLMLLLLLLLAAV